MINPPKPPEGPKPTKALFKSLYDELAAPFNTEDSNKLKNHMEPNVIPQKTIATLEEDQYSLLMNKSSNSSNSRMKSRDEGKSVNFL